MLLRLDPADAQPLYAQLAGQLRSAVARGEVAPGERLPTARDLAASLDVHLHTVLRAYQELRDEGLVELRRGRGAVVVARSPADLADLHDAVAHLVRTARRLGVAPQTALALVKESLR